MTTVMAERIRLIIDTDDIVRRAVQLRKVKGGSGGSASEIVTAILREALVDEIKELEQHDEAQQAKKGRAKKGGE